MVRFLKFAFGKVYMWRDAPSLSFNYCLGEVRKRELDESRSSVKEEPEILGLYFVWFVLVCDADVRSDIMASHYRAVFFSFFIVRFISRGAVSLPLPQLWDPP